MTVGRDRQHQKTRREAEIIGTREVIVGLQRGDGRASFLASYEKILRGGNSPGEAFFAKLMIKDKLIMALVDSGSSNILLSETLYQQLGETSQIRVNKKI